MSILLEIDELIREWNNSDDEEKVEIENELHVIYRKLDLFFDNFDSFMV